MKNIDYTQEFIDLTDVSGEKEMIEILTSEEFKERLNKSYGFCGCIINTMDNDCKIIKLKVNVTAVWVENIKFGGPWLMVSVIDNEEDFHMILWFDDTKFLPDNDVRLEEQGWPENWNYEEEEE